MGNLVLISKVGWWLILWASSPPFHMTLILISASPWAIYRVASSPILAGDFRCCHLIEEQEKNEGGGDRHHSDITSSFLCNSRSDTIVAMSEQCLFVSSHPLNLQLVVSSGPTILSVYLLNTENLWSSYHFFVLYRWAPQDSLEISWLKRHWSLGILGLNYYHCFNFHISSR